MTGSCVTVEPTADQDAAARLLHRHRLTALPVVADGQLLGVLTLDDVADIVEEEATEDAVSQGGAQPLDVPYLRASPWQLWRKRIGWLLILFLAEMYTGTVLRAFEEELETVIALAAFIPLLIGTGGNAGTQITTPLIRAMAVGEVRFRDAREDFYRTARSLENSLGVSGSMAGGHYNFGISHLDQSGIVPNAKLNRLNLNANVTLNLTSFLQSNTTVLFSNTQNDFQNEGWFGGARTLIYLPPNRDIRKAWNADGPAVSAAPVTRPASEGSRTTCGSRRPGGGCGGPSSSARARARSRARRGRPARRPSP